MKKIKIIASNVEVEKEDIFDFAENLFVATLCGEKVYPFLELREDILDLDLHENIN